jgi:hypothetical protein
MPPHDIKAEDFEKLPGLFQAWDLSSVLTHGELWLVEGAGFTDDGEPLFMVFRRVREAEAATGEARL